MLTTWIVVADSSRARFFLMENRNEPLTELDGMAHIEGRLREGDVISDRQGGLAGGHGEGGHPFEAPTDLKQHEMELFAKQIADKLEQGRVNHSYRKLILAAPPAMLGALRQSLNAQVLAMVGSSIDKNLVSEHADEIHRRIIV
ncbi:MAG: host attachment protein [Methylomonas sp.]|jgi:protein required for attachment to host cells